MTNITYPKLAEYISDYINEELQMAYMPDVGIDTHMIMEAIEAYKGGAADM